MSCSRLRLLLVSLPLACTACDRATEPATPLVAVRLPAGDTVDTRRLDAVGAVRLVASIRNVGSDTVWLARECRFPSANRAWVSTVRDGDWLHPEVSPTPCLLVLFPVDSGLALAPGTERTDTLSVFAPHLEWWLEGSGRRIRLRYLASRRPFRTHDDPGDPVPVADRTSPPVTIVGQPAW
jgi:hypothetical protein